jgi:hypothetical protein
MKGIGRAAGLYAAAIIPGASILPTTAGDVCDEPSLNIRTHAKNACVRHPTKS